MEALSGKKIRENVNVTLQRKLSDIHIFEQLDSTNTWLLKHKQCGVLCLAEAQLAGRGCHGRQWISPATGNIYLSYCYCFDVLPKTFSLSTLAVGIAVCEALKEIGLQGHGLKWPNDIYINNKKLAGILLETAGSLQRLVIGIGLNITIDSQTEIDQPWCCLDEVLFASVDRNMFIACILNHVQEQLDALQQEKMESFRTQWQQWDILLNKKVNVVRGNESMWGKVVGINTKGQLGVRFSQGHLQYLSAAEIKVHC
jgi:BirA family biotin operon repressor/biotin-[acetyl-CoA-carboxylase] ligase